MKFADIINADKPALVDFSAEWCAPCKMMAPILKEVVDGVGEKAAVLKVDVDRNPEAAAPYHVQSVPTLILFKNGEVKWRQAGVVPAYHLKQIIEQNL
jgi:thioredoxin 1